MDLSFCFGSTVAVAFWPRGCRVKRQNTNSSFDVIKHAYIYELWNWLATFCSLRSLLSDSFFWKVVGDNPLIDHDGDVEAEILKL